MYKHVCKAVKWIKLRNTFETIVSKIGLLQYHILSDICQKTKVSKWCDEMWRKETISIKSVIDVTS